MLARVQQRLKSQLEWADILRGDGGKVEMLLFIDKKGNLKRKLKQQSAVGLSKSP